MKVVGAIIFTSALCGCSPQPDVLSVSADVVASPSGDFATPSSDASIWSASGVLMRDRPVFSPDGRFILQWTEHGVSVSGEARGLLTSRVMGDAPPEILWSPGRDYVAITWSDDTAIPAWGTEAYYLGNGTPREIGVAGLYRSWDQTFSGITPVAPLPNVAAIAWLNDDSKLLLAVEQPMNGSWMHGMMVSGVVYSIPDEKITDSFDGVHLLDTNRKDLGQRLLRDLEQQN